MNIRSPAIISSLGLLVGFGTIMFVHEAYLANYLNPGQETLSEATQDVSDSLEQPASQVALSTETPESDDDSGTTLNDIDSGVLSPDTPVLSESGAEGISQNELSSSDLPVAEAENASANERLSTEDREAGDLEIENSAVSGESVPEGELPSTESVAAMSQPDAAAVENVAIWSAVWRPFFSPATAKGFSDYIGKATGLSLRVAESRVPGQYLVEVKHVSEAERLAADRLIVETTGYRPTDALR